MGLEFKDNSSENASVTKEADARQRMTAKDTLCLPIGPKERKRTRSLQQYHLKGSLNQC
jgi:hypothetical protein